MMVLLVTIWHCRRYRKRDSFRYRSDHSLSAAGDREGAVYVFTRNGTEWPQTNKLVIEPARRFAFLGTSVDTTGDTVAVGALLWEVMARSYSANVVVGIGQSHKFRTARTGRPFSTTELWLVGCDIRRSRVGRRSRGWSKRLTGWRCLHL